MSVNKLFLLGHVGGDPEIKSFDNGSIASFNLATTEKGYTTKTGAVVPDSTQWHRIVAKAGLAKFAETYVKKGAALFIEGKVIYRSYDNKDGVKVFITEIIASEMQFTSAKIESKAPEQNNPAPQAANYEANGGQVGEDNMPF